MIYVKYTRGDEPHEVTIWAMPSDLSKECCIYNESGFKVDKDWKEYNEETALHDLENGNEAEVLTLDQALLEMI